MKKISRLFGFLAVITLFSLMALGSGSSDDSSKKDIVASETQTSDTNTKVETDDKPDAKGVSIEEQVVFDANDIVITAKEYVHDSIWGDGVKLLIENNSSSDIGVGCDALIVNNYMITDLFSSTVAAGKKANETMHLMSSELSAAGIESIGQIEIYFHLFDPSSYMTTYKAEVATIKTSEYDSMDTTPNDIGKELYNDEGIRIVGKYVNENSFWGAGVLLFIENNYGKNIGVQCEDMSINGFMVTPFFSSTVYNGKMAIDDITIMSSDLEENGIESVDEIELKFHIYDAETYMTIKDSEPIAFSTK